MDIKLSPNNNQYLKMRNN